MLTKMIYLDFLVLTFLLGYLNNSSEKKKIVTSLKISVKYALIVSDPCLRYNTLKMQCNLK